jgi:hypothetical protein
MVVMTGKLGGERGNGERGDEERRGGGHEIAQRERRGWGPAERGLHHGRSARRIRMRITPGSGSSVSCTKPRSSS